MLSALSFFEVEYILIQANASKTKWMLPLKIGEASIMQINYSIPITCPGKLGKYQADLIIR